MKFAKLLLFGSVVFLINGCTQLEKQTIDQAFFDYKTINMSAERAETPDQATIDWGSGVLAELNLEDLSITEKAAAIQQYITDHFRFTSDRPRNILEFLESRSGNCRAHSLLSIFLLRLSGVPAKFAYEVHLELKTKQSAETARSRGTGLFGRFHNDHLWVLYFDGKRWIPLDSALGYTGYEEFKARWDGSGDMPANPPFIIWEDTGTGTSDMTNVTEYIWDKFDLSDYNDVTVNEWKEFISYFYDKDLSLFRQPLSAEIETEIAGIAKQYFSSSRIRKVEMDPGIKQYLDLLDSDSEYYYFFEPEMNSLGYDALQDGNTAMAVALFKLNTEAYPDSYNAFDSLGEAYAKNGDTELAIRNYTKSLELNPGNSNAEHQIEKLKN